MSTSPVTIALVQMSCSEDPAANTARAYALAEQAIGEGAQIICLPELFKTRYFCQTENEEHFARAEPVPGPTTDAFARLAGEHDVTMILSLFEKRAPGLYHNTAAVVDGARGYVGMYRKMHIPDDPKYYEKFYFAPGDLGFRAFPTRHGTLGVLICWDQWYPEAARLTALRGADILFYPTAIGWHPRERNALGDKQHDAWELSQRAHAVANGCYVAAVNRTGFEPTPGSDGEDGIQFWGQSFIAAPDGSICRRAGSTDPEIIIETLDMDAIETARIGWPFLRDRRIDAYENLTKRFID